MRRHWKQTPANAAGNPYKHSSLSHYLWGGELKILKTVLIPYCKIPDKNFLHHIVLESPLKCNKLLLHIHKIVSKIRRQRFELAYLAMRQCDKRHNQYILSECYNFDSWELYNFIFALCVRKRYNYFH